MKPRFNQTRLVLKTALQLPATPPVSFKLSASQIWDSAGTQNTIAGQEKGSRGDARLLRLDNWQGAPEEVVARENAGKIPAIIPGYKLHSVDNFATDYRRNKAILPPGVTQSEEDLIRLALVKVRANIKQITDKPDKDKTDEDKALLLELQEEEAGLNSNGFLENIPGTIFGGGAMGVYRRLSSANVPFSYTARQLPSYLGENGLITYNSKLESRPFTLWLHRWKPRVGQIDHRLSIDLSLWRLEFEGDDRAIFYRKNEDRSDSEAESKGARRDVLRAKRTLSVKQSMEIEAKRDEIDKIKADAKTAKKKLTDTEKAKVKKLGEEIKAIQKQVGLTDADKAELKELEKFLFRQIETVELNETAQSLIDKAFSLTFIDTGVGFLQIELDIGRNKWVFEDQWATARRIEKPLWGDDILTIRGTGGAVAWRFGYVQINAREEITTAPQWVGLGADLQGAPVVGRWLTPKGTSVNFALDEMANGTARARMVLTSDTRHLPIVFRATVQLPATASPPHTVVWESSAHAGTTISSNVSLDAGRRSALWQLNLTCTEGFEAMGLPNALTGLTADIYIGDERVLTDGVVVDDTASAVREINDTPKIEKWGMVRLTVRDKSERVNDSRINEEVELDGLWIGDAIYHLRRNMGATEDALSLLPRGADSGWKLQTAGAGEKAAFAPTLKSRRLEYINNELVRRFGLGRQYYIDSEGRDRLEFPSNRAKKDENGQTIVYRPVAANANPNSIAPRASYWSENGLERSRSFENYYTYFEVQGAVDPDTKKRRTLAYNIDEAIDPSNKEETFYTGTPRPLEPISDDAFITDADLEVVLRTAIALHGFPRVTFPTRCPYAPWILPGEVFMVADEAGTVSPWRIHSASSVDDVVSDTMEVIWETPY